MLVISLLVILGGILVVTVGAQGDKARIKMGRDLVENEIPAALDFYKNDMGQYPSSDEGLKVLLSKEGLDEEKAKSWGGPYLKKEPLDPWDKSLHYERVDAAASTPGAVAYHVWSEGPDGVNSNEDDIKSWKE
jgi:general secretion pathway protein G